MLRRPVIVEVRRVRADDGEFLASCEWVAVDNRGYRFGAESEQAARALADEYHHPTHTSRERGRVSHPMPIV